MLFNKAVGDRLDWPALVEVGRAFGGVAVLAHEASWGVVGGASNYAFAVGVFLGAAV